ncbi:MAG: prephenate dehydratase [Planctomycetota bacterium]
MADPKQNEMPPDDNELESRLRPMRDRIDQLDDDLVKLLNERARVAVEIGRAKREAAGGSGGTASFYVPSRERAVFDKIHRLNEGPLGDRTLDAVWREIMSGSIGLQKPLRVAYLGPAGSFSHAAAIGKFGNSVDYVPASDIDAVFGSVARRHADCGLVPVENSSHGGVIDTLDAFLDHSAKVCAEVLITIHHCVLCRGPWDEVKTVTTKPEVLAQCRGWLGDVAGRRSVEPAASTSAAAERAAADPTVAAIASRLAGEIYDVPRLFENIEDDPDNVTRFWVIGSEAAKPTGEDKTGVLFTTANKPGALVAVLDSFRDNGVNLTDIEKRPSGRTNWEYVFFVDAEGHESDPKLQAAITAAREHCLQLTVLGSYPRASDVL